MISGVYVYKNNGYNGRHLYYMRVRVDIVSPRNFSTRQSVYRETEHKKKIIYEHNNNQNTREEINMCVREGDDTLQVPMYVYVDELIFYHYEIATQRSGETSCIRYII